MVNFEYLDDIERRRQVEDIFDYEAAGDRAEIAFDRGRGLYLAGCFADALAAYEQATQRSPRFLRAQASAIDTLLEMGLVAQAESQADSLLERYNSNTDLGVARAHCYVHRCRRRAAEGDVESAEFHYGLARTFCDIALEARPDSSYAWLRKGEVNLARRHKLSVSMARECFENARQQHDEWTFHVEVAMIAFDWGWYAEAEAWLVEAGKMDMGRACVWYWLGLTHMALRSKTNARECFGRALALDPNYGEAEQALLRCSPVRRIISFVTVRKRAKTTVWRSVRNAGHPRGD